VPPVSPEPDPQCIENGGSFGKQYLHSDTGTLKNPDYFVGSRNDCGPKDEVAFDDRCTSAWFGKWDGYFNVPAGEAGDYEFMVQFQPQLSINFDVNQDGNFSDEDTCWPFGSVRAGDRFFYMNTLLCSSQYRHKVLRKFAGLGTDPFPSASPQGDSGGTHWGHCNRNTDADPTGTDFFNFDAAYTPAGGTYPEYPDFKSWGYTVYDDTINWPGTAECPVAMNIPHSIGTGNENASINGETWVSFTRNLSEGQHRMKVNFNSRYGAGSEVHHLRMWYRRPPTPYQWDWPGSGGWIDLNALAAPPDCPFSPTAIPCPPPLQGWWQAQGGHTFSFLTS